MQGPAWASVPPTLSISCNFTYTTKSSTWAPNSDGSPSSQITDDELMNRSGTPWVMTPSHTSAACRITAFWAAVGWSPT